MSNGGNLDILVINCFMNPRNNRDPGNGELALTMNAGTLRSPVVIRIVTFLLVTTAYTAHLSRADDAPVAPLRACWSPDSSRVAFILPEENETDCLDVAKSDRVPKARPVFKRTRLTAVSWAPSGAHIAAASAPDDGEAVVHLINTADLTREDIKLGRAAKEVSLGWSADGTRIIVQCDRTIMFVRLDDRNVETLETVKPSVSRVFFNGKSPLAQDNKLLLAAGPMDPFTWTFSYREAMPAEGSEQIDLYAWLVKVEGEKYALPVTQHGSLAGPLVWSPNGKALAFVTRTVAPASRRGISIATFWLNMASDIGAPQIEPIRIVNPLSTTPIWSPSSVDAGCFWKDATGKCFATISRTQFSTIVPLEKRLERVLFASWNEPASVFLVALTEDHEPICAIIDLQSGEVRRLSTSPVPLDQFVPSPDLTKLLVMTKLEGKPQFELYTVKTGDIVRIRQTTDTP